jgi:ATP-dependent exoDNAse (exonuclease V) alpha subunit
VAIDAYAAHDRIHVADTREATCEQLVGDWWNAAFEHRLDAIMIAARRIDVADLNTRARQRMSQAGELAGPILEIAGRVFQAGDRIVCLRNDPRLKVTNGTRGTVTHVDADEQTLWFQPDDGASPLRLPQEYLEQGHVDHAYAITAHKAQGLTCDATFVLADETIYREWGYVALSRGRHDNHLYIGGDAFDVLDEHVHQRALAADRGDDHATSLPRRLERSRAETLALKQVRSGRARESERSTDRRAGHELERDLGMEFGL